jgi:hypothetical protein
VYKLGKPWKEGRKEEREGGRKGREKRKDFFNALSSMLCDEL